MKLEVVARDTAADSYAKGGLGGGRGGGNRLIFGGCREETLGGRERGRGRRTGRMTLSADKK